MHAPNVHVVSAHAWVHHIMCVHACIHNICVCLLHIRTYTYTCMHAWNVHVVCVHMTTSERLTISHLLDSITFAEFKIFPRSIRLECHPLRLIIGKLQVQDTRYSRSSQGCLVGSLNVHMKWAHNTCTKQRWGCLWVAHISAAHPGVSGTTWTTDGMVQSKIRILSIL